MSPAGCLRWRAGCLRWQAAAVEVVLTMFLTGAPVQQVGREAARSARQQAA